MITEGGNCPFCLGVGTGNMKLDKRGAPYFTCFACGTRAFIHSPIALETFKWILSSGTSYYREMKRVAALTPEVAGVSNGE